MTIEERNIHLEGLYDEYPEIGIEVKALSTDPKMTVKEVSEILKLDRRTIQMKVKELFPDMVKERETTYLNQTQVTMVKLSCEKTFAVKTEMEKDLIIQQAMMFQNEKVANLLAKNEILQIELDESKQYHSVKRVKMLGYIPEVSARKAWNPLKKWSIENNYRIISIFDANYGEVSTYHAAAWKAVYGVEL
jgi:DNA-binding Lrp family transcriptional regulator